MTKIISRLAWLGLILIPIMLYFSSSMPYEEQSLVPLLQFLLPNQPLHGTLSQISFSYGGEVISIATSSYYHFIEFFIRKGAHLTMFGCLGLMFYLAWMTHIKNGLVLCLTAAGLTFGMAAFDELRQVYTLNRSGMLADVYLDTVGAIVCILLAHLIRWLIGKFQARRTDRVV
ncbi:hypothetical protein AWM75_08025 [Aerococcus urinaehominis]|uniref:VanZ-like domain-containing protein n=1 Tax=Aerococcus urinaehominis TaxID=128944 RepID=A0A0X8FM93_9LACT|nr:VanZ family protein [Aerococcus urinaehominis]AMB99918.1 hypothetical protein AWM75_08025 [Aerococcus urinaehominis]SDM43479.1 VanZ like family protein [Aerococcus urinaehominis]